jgi:hypothetical protein
VVKPISAGHTPTWWPRFSAVPSHQPHRHPADGLRPIGDVVDRDRDLVQIVDDGHSAAGPAAIACPTTLLQRDLAVLLAVDGDAALGVDRIDGVGIRRPIDAESDHRQDGLALSLIGGHLLGEALEVGVLVVAALGLIGASGLVVSFPSRGIGEARQLLGSGLADAGIASQLIGVIAGVGVDAGAQDRQHHHHQEPRQQGPPHCEHPGKNVVMPGAALHDLSNHERDLEGQGVSARSNAQAAGEEEQAQDGDGCRSRAESAAVPAAIAG